MSRNRAIFEMLLCAAMWSIAGIFIKLVPWNSMVIAGIRSLIAGAVMLAYMRHKRIGFTADRRSLPGAAAPAPSFLRRRCVAPQPTLDLLC